jgi:N-methylhydantoinase B
VSGGTSTADVRADAVEIELFRYANRSVIDEIEVNLTRTAYSPMIYEYKDYAVSLWDPDFRQVAMATSGALMLGNLGPPMRDAVEVIGPENLRDGDVFLTNYARVQGQHLNNVVMIRPLFVEGTIAAYIAISAHWADVGGIAPGSMSWAAQDIAQEGVQYRALLVVRGGELDRGAMATIEANTRLPDYVRGDFMAMLGGCAHGTERWHERVGGRWDLRSIRRLTALQFQQSTTTARARIAALPDGEYTVETMLDDQGRPGTEPYPLALTVRVRGEEMEVDLTRMPPQVDAPINTGREAGAVSAVRVGYKALIGPDAPVDEGLWEPLTVTTVPGTIVSAVGSAPMGHWNTTIATVADMVVRAVGSADPTLAVGGHGGHVGHFGFYGRDANGRWWTFVDTMMGGHGASAYADGASALKSLVHGDTRDIPIETIERRFPLRVHGYRLLPGSGGRGHHDGGMATEKIFETLDDVHAEFGVDRTLAPPWGLNGGEEGTPADITVRFPGSDTWESRKKATQLLLPRGTLVKIRSAGGGGWGQPVDGEVH